MGSAECMIFTTDTQLNNEQMNKQWLSVHTVSKQIGKQTYELMSTERMKNKQANNWTSDRWMNKKEREAQRQKLDEIDGKKIKAETAEEAV